MESVPAIVTKSSSNVLLKISELCKQRSVGVSPYSEIPKTSNPKETIDASGDQKTHPQLSVATLSSSSEVSGEAVLLCLLEAISTLKIAYVQLQQAHITRNPDKLKVADKLVVSGLEFFSELEDLYNENQRSKPDYQISMRTKIQEQHKLLAELQKILQEKESDIARTRLEFDELNTSTLELKKRLEQKAMSKERSFLLKRELPSNTFSELYKFASKSIHDFTKPLISLMKASGWNLDQAVGWIGNEILYGKQAHKKYAFESYLSRIMLIGAHDEWLAMGAFNHIMSFCDTFDALLEDPDSDFGRFCRLKYLEAIPSKMEDSFFGNLDHRAFVLAGGHLRTPFYQAFVNMAKWVWGVQKVASSSDPRAVIFYAQGGTEYKEDHMESVGAEVASNKTEKLRVGFTVMPGFKIGGAVIRCRVYLSGIGRSCQEL